MFFQENNLSGNLGVVEGTGTTFVKDFIQAIAEHRHWDRKMV